MSGGLFAGSGLLQRLRSVPVAVAARRKVSRVNSPAALKASGLAPSRKLKSNCVPVKLGTTPAAKTSVSVRKPPCRSGTTSRFTVPPVCW